VAGLGFKSLRWLHPTRPVSFDKNRSGLFLRHTVNTPLLNGVFCLPQDAPLDGWSLHAPAWYTKTEGKDDSPFACSEGPSFREVEMLQDILFVIALFVTRMVLPIAFTLFLGYRLERKLNQRPHSS
jgi:hypothetical protein